MQGVYRRADRIALQMAARRRLPVGVAVVIEPSTGSLSAALRTSRPLTARLQVTPILSARLKAGYDGD